MASLWLFFLALAVVFLLPGPDMILLLQTGARQGRGAALGRWLQHSPTAQRVQQWLFGSLLIGFALRLTFIQQA